MLVVLVADEKLSIIFLVLTRVLRLYLECDMSFWKTLSGVCCVFRELDQSSAPVL